MKWKSLLVFALGVPALAIANPTRTGARKEVRKEVEKITDRHAWQQKLRANGFKARGGIDKSETERDDDDRNRSFPHFTQSFTYGGVNYPYTMVGYPPRSGRSTTVRSVIVPMKVTFAYFGASGEVSHTFDPGPAVTSIVNSPLYKDASFANGRGQFGDQLQRAAFWNQMDRHHSWHVRMDRPRIAKPLEIVVTPEFGVLAQDSDGNFFGDMSIDATDAIINTYIQAGEIDPDELPIFVTDDVTAEALGYHSASQYAGSNVLQTYIWTSWLDPTLVDPIVADVSTFNHELAEWLNDPYINNIVPTWNYPPPGDPRVVCSDNPFLEVGDPEGNGPTYNDFPTVPITLAGVTYHLQDIALLQWFTGESPSSAYGGWYDFPATTYLTQPFVPCP